MLNEMLGTWLDKRKARKELFKTYKLYEKKKKSYLKPSTIEIYEQLQDIQFAIAYVLCEYFDFNYEFYYDNNPFSYKWYIANDYVACPNRCKEAYVKFVKENAPILIRGDNIIYVMGTDDLQKIIDSRSNHAHMIYDIENDYMYWRDKHENVWKRY